MGVLDNFNPGKVLNNVMTSVAPSFGGLNPQQMLIPGTGGLSPTIMAQNNLIQGKRSKKDLIADPVGYTNAGPTLSPIVTPGMPDIAAISEAMQNSVAAQIARQGRMSTIMSGTSKTDRLGG